MFAKMKIFRENHFEYEAKIYEQIYEEKADIRK